jgi:hypothetical protein
MLRFNYNQLIIGDTCGNISGKIYADLNGNCIFDSSDFPLSGIQVRLMQGTNIIKSNFSKSNGDLEMFQVCGVSGLLLSFFFNRVSSLSPVTLF